MDNPGKLARYGTQETQNKITTPYMLDTTKRKQTQITYKTWVLLQTTGGKDELNIVFMRKSYWTSQHGNQNVKTHNRTT